jgi:hypothetical protein
MKGRPMKWLMQQIAEWLVVLGIAFVVALVVLVIPGWLGYWAAHHLCLHVSWR